MVLCHLYNTTTYIHAHIYWNFCLQYRYITVEFVFFSSFQLTWWLHMRRVCNDFCFFEMISLFGLCWQNWICCVVRREFRRKKKNKSKATIDFVAVTNILVIPPPPPPPPPPSPYVFWWKLVVFDWNIKCINVNDIFKKPFLSYCCAAYSAPNSLATSVLLALFDVIISLLLCHQI